MIRLFRVFVPVSVFTLLVSEVLLITSVYILAAFLVMEVDPTVYLLYGGGLVSILLVVLSVISALHFQDLYSNVHVRSRIVLLQQLCLVMGVAFLLQGMIAYFDANLRTPLRLMMVGSALNIVAIFCWRVFFSAYALQVVGAERVLLVGDSPLLAEVARHINEHPEIGLTVAGCVNDNPDALSADAKTLGPVASLLDIALATRPDRIVVGMAERRSRVPVEDLLELRLGGTFVEEVGTAHERVTGRVCVQELRPAQLIYSDGIGPRRQDVFYRRLGSSVVAVFALIGAAPVMLFTALAVRFSSPGPVLYKQQRVGLNGVPFTLYKFRSMCADAEAATGAVWAAKDDPRITSVGRIIRKLRIDELPQLLNVLKGDMSIVGPRPERPELVKALSVIPYYRQRHCVLPGITGWAQINYKYGDTMEDAVKKLEYDLYYIKNMSLGLDLYTVFHTAKTILLSRGAQ